MQFWSRWAGLVYGGQTALGPKNNKGHVFRNSTLRSTIARVQFAIIELRLTITNVQFAIRHLRIGITK